jgi:DhnA family fructose-bisphosphate aldolase class Ia
MASPAVHAATSMRSLSGRCAPGIVLCLDWTNQFRGADELGYAEGRSTLLASVDDAVRLGADAVMTYLFLGAYSAQSVHPVRGFRPPWSEAAERPT